MAKLSKPLFCARFALVNNLYYKASTIRDLFAPELRKFGYETYQLPSVKHYLAKFTIKDEGPFPGDDAKSVYRTMTVLGPNGKELKLTLDLTNDPKGSRPIIEKKTPYITTVTWNIAAPPGATEKDLEDILWQLRRQKLYNKRTQLGLGFTPTVLPYDKTPVALAGYQNRPPIPTELLSTDPERKPTPKPTPKPAPIAPIAPAPSNPETSAWYKNWKVWASLGGAATLLSVIFRKKR